MPELPEVEVVCQGICPVIKGRFLNSATFSGKRLRLPMPEWVIKKMVVNQTITEVRRRAKYIIIILSNGVRLIIHLGMTGKLGIFPAASPPALHDHLRLRLDNDMELRFNDTRRFGSIQVLNNQAEELNFFAPLGPEPLEEGEFNAAYLFKKAAGRKQPLKNFLMDSHVVVGIGNIYANEIPFAAGIAPQKPIGKITKSAWHKIVTQTRKVLKRAIAAGGSTISDFINASGKPGYFQLQLKVYGRVGQPCQTCGKEIQKTAMAGRATFWCPKCQK
jgi:formamidopyrimidine-DNA glycosylase